MCPAADFLYVFFNPFTSNNSTEKENSIKQKYQIQRKKSSLAFLTSNGRYLQSYVHDLFFKHVYLRLEKIEPLIKTLLNAYTSSYS